VTSLAIGPRSVVRQVTARLGTPPDAAGLFFSVGSLKAAVLRENPILSGTGAERQAAQAAARQSMPRAVAIAVLGGSAVVFPAVTTGDVTGDPILTLRAGSFSARASRTIFTVVLTLGVNGRTLQFEAKRFPVGINRHNDRIVALIVSLGQAA
jgi:hypothetical protein